MIITGYTNCPFAAQQDSVPPVLLLLSLYITQHTQVPWSKFVPCFTLLAQINENIHLRIVQTLVVVSILLLLTL